mmetsp:Transcript_14104/g.30635  ORF Transcript_14104/g.30635 Transcript_14104/m.30635 type:complete len:164 (-) Transcript_14104:404-895(-)|eukprot:CAMPEP_0178502100 /NCGR_PEP_ID=MMETSP0696-20121128/17325_1 /TAXON_ID=265572 /ORGANISM="Extubocellulus spinifer, Strain CCMP396" /LENGTH=163 /DNA_ID=CAMNT_0020131137 /DNA_START=51 /DNA_END=542 /DNA_ORIENTATION=+
MTLPPAIEKAIDKTDAFLAKYPNLTQYEKLKEIEEKTGQPKVYFFIAFCLLLCGFVFLIGGAKLASDLVSFIYPAYMSFKAIDTANPTDDKQWLTYWVVFGFTSIIESCASFIIGWIPFYFFLKIAFFVWLYHPNFLGAGIIYTQALRPILLPYLGKVEKKTS